MKKVSLIILLLVCGLKLQSQTSKATIKSWFETGDVPTQTQFWNFIDNSYNEVTDDLLKGQGFPTIKYSPFTVKTPGKIYSGTTNPSSSNRLNYDGYFYATKFYNAAGQEITPGVAVDTANSTTSGLVSPYRYGYWNGKLDRSKYISDTSSRRKVMTRKAVDSLIAISTTGKVSYIGTYNPSGNTFPTTGSGGGTIKKGDYWDLSGSGTLGGVAVDNTMSIISRIDNPGQTLANWDLQGQVVQQAVARKAGDVGIGFVEYTAQTQTSGKFYSLSGNTKLNYVGELGATNFTANSSANVAGYFKSSTNMGVYAEGSLYGVSGYTSTGIGGQFYADGGTPLKCIKTVASGNIAEFRQPAATLLASIDYTGRGTFANGVSLSTAGGGNPPLYITGNQSGYVSAQIGLTNGAFGWATANSSTAGSFYAQNTSIGTGDYYQGWKESTKVFSVDKDGKLTANGADFGTRTAAGTHVQLVNSSTGQGFYLGNSTTGQGMQINNYGTGLGLNLFNTSSGIGLQLNNSSTGQGIYINQTNGGIPFQIDSASNVRTKIESDGTLVFSGNATYWNDLQFPFTTAKLTGNSDPTFSKITDNGSGSTGIYAYSFSPTVTNEVFVGKEMDHEYKEGSNEYIHYHIYPSDNTAGNVVLFCEYVTNNIDAVLGNSTLVTVTVPIPANSAKKQIVVDIATITGTGLKISHGVSMRCGRLGADAADTYTGAIWITRAAVHYEIDMLGSRTQKTK